MQSAELIKLQLKRGLMPQSYLFLGADEVSKKAACDMVLKHFLGENFQKSPDFYILQQKPISIDDIRLMRSRFYQKPFFGEKTVFFITSIENLSREAAPALLKILEEPPPHAFILATTSHLSMVLPTIKSRFSKLNFPPQIRRKIRTYSGADLIKAERELRAKVLLMDPTINKRLVEEYLTMM